MSLKNVSKALITGNTYPVREKIKKLGGTWSAGQKGWIIEIRTHAFNTMRGRSKLDSSLRDLERDGCKIEYIS